MLKALHGLYHVVILTTSRKKERGKEREKKRGVCMTEIIREILGPRGGTRFVCAVWQLRRGQVKVAKSGPVHPQTGRTKVQWGKVTLEGSKMIPGTLWLVLQRKKAFCSFGWLSTFTKWMVARKPFEENGKIAGAKWFLFLRSRNQGHLPRGLKAVAWWVERSSEIPSAELPNIQYPLSLKATIYIIPLNLPTHGSIFPHLMLHYENRNWTSKRLPP